VLWELGTHFLDQLLQLTADRPASVFARATANGNLAEGFVVVVEFSRGAIATLDISRSSLIPRDTGWELNGSLGSYAAGVHYSATREGEVEDVPAAGVAADPDAFYEAVARHLRGSGPNPVPAEQAVDVVRLIESICQSAETGTVVSL
jgi:predicted dehydrogenase